MFVRQSKYDKAKRESDEYMTIAIMFKRKYDALLDEWNDLVGRVNAAGGVSGIKKRNEAQNPFSQEDIKRLLMLCHPDRHGGKQMAVEMTQKLTAMRNR